MRDAWKTLTQLIVDPQDAGFVVQRNAPPGVPVAICGEMGGRPLEALALIGIGIDRLSITPAAVGPIKAMVQSLNYAAVRAEMSRLLADPPRDMRAALGTWAQTNGVELG